MKDLSGKSLAENALSYFSQNTIATSPQSRLLAMTKDRHLRPRYIFQEKLWVATRHPKNYFPVRCLNASYSTMPVLTDAFSEES